MNLQLTFLNLRAAAHENILHISTSENGHCSSEKQGAHQDDDWRDGIGYSSEEEYEDRYHEDYG
jgi:hypothetical protein